MLGCRIKTVGGARLKASVRFLLLRGMYQRGTCKGWDKNLKQLLRIYRARLQTCVAGVSFIT